MLRANQTHFRAPVVLRPASPARLASPPAPYVEPSFTYYAPFEAMTQLEQIHCTTEQFTAPRVTHEGEPRKRKIDLYSTDLDVWTAKGTHAGHLYWVDRFIQTMGLIRSRNEALKHVQERMYEATRRDMKLFADAKRCAEEGNASSQCAPGGGGGGALLKRSHATAFARPDQVVLNAKERRRLFQMVCLDQGDNTCDKDYSKWRGFCHEAHTLLLEMDEQLITNRYLVKTYNAKITARKTEHKARYPHAVYNADGYISDYHPAQDDQDSLMLEDEAEAEDEAEDEPESEVDYDSDARLDELLRVGVEGYQDGEYDAEAYGTPTRLDLTILSYFRDRSNDAALT
jgi:hypothetical protein